MSYCSTILSQVLKEVNKYDFENQVSKYNGDRKTKKIECKDILTTMIFSQLARHDFTRDIINGLKTFQNDYYHLGIDHEIKRSSFSYALNNKPYIIFEDFFYSMLKELTSEQKRKFNRKVNLIDSSTISLCLERFDWAKYKRAKGGIELHTMIDRLRKTISEQVINFKKHKIRLTCSFGIAFFNRQTYKSNITCDDILATADTALHLSKEEGKNTVKMFDVDLVKI